MLVYATLGRFVCVCAWFSAAVIVGNWKTAIQAGWHAVAQEQIRRRIEGIPKRCIPIGCESDSSDTWSIDTNRDSFTLDNRSINPTFHSKLTDSRTSIIQAGLLPLYRQTACGHWEGSISTALVIDVPLIA